MGRPPVLPAAEKEWFILSILTGELTVAAAARQGWVFEQVMGMWKRQFLEGGAAGVSAKPSSREQQLAAEVADLTTARGEAAVELRVWKSPAEREVPPVR